MAKTHPKHHHRHPKKKAPPKTLLDKLIYFAAFVQPFTTLPQIYTIWVQKSNGSSLFSWVAYLFFSFIWLAYSLKIKSKPLIISYILWIIFEGLVVAGLVCQHFR